jgi:hypothetical protein
MSSGRRGRPIGFRLSEASRRAISESKKGQKHKQETKNKISDSLILYFKKKNPLSEELTKMYCDESHPEVCEWMEDNKNELDRIDDVMTLKAVRNSNRIELVIGSNIEYFSHEVTPELLVLFLEQCDILDLDPSEYFDALG